MTWHRFDGCSGPVYVRLPPDVGARAGAVQEAPPVGAWVVVGFALVRYS